MRGSAICVGSSEPYSGILHGVILANMLASAISYRCGWVLPWCTLACWGCCEGSAQQFPKSPLLESTGPRRLTARAATLCDLDRVRNHGTGQLWARFLQSVPAPRSDDGWKTTTHNGIKFTSATTLNPQWIDTAFRAWLQAANQFPPRQGVRPSVVFAPTTEVFRQLTLQPGWDLASTSGTTITLQPAAVFDRNHVSLARTLQHEMLHVAVESRASAKAPLWLREGLVELLAGEVKGDSPTLSAEQTERLLRSASTRRLSQQAHAAAEARTRLLAARYGFSAVRDWLVSGSPLPAH